MPPAVPASPPAGGDSSHAAKKKSAAIAIRLIARTYHAPREAGVARCLDRVLTARIAFLGEIAALASAVTWAFANIAYARLPTTATPFALTTLKAVLATVMLWLTLIAAESTVFPALSSRELLFLVISALIGITFGDVAYFNALIRIGARRAVFLSTLVPPSSALVAYFAFGETLSPLEILGMILTLGGVTLVLYQRSGNVPKDRSSFGTGLALGLAAVAAQIAANILTKEGAGGHSALAVSTARMIFGSAGLLAYAAAARRTRDVFRPLGEKRTAGLIFVATLLGTYFGVWFYMAAIMYTDVGVAVTLSATSPIFITALAHFFLAERATFRSFAGGAICVAGVALLFAG
jgi:drug/metabolite transporter (DMT)-like permease